MTRILLSPPHVTDRDRTALLRAFDSNWIAPTGPDVTGFEHDVAAFVGAPDAAALSSGTAALHLALVLLGVGPGDEVIVPSATFAATPNAVSYVGAHPRFVDSERASWNLCPDLLAEELAELAALGKPPAAVIVVDLYGHCADYDRIVDVCATYDVPIIEDAAEALGATYNGRDGATAAGMLGDIGIFSFNGNKIMTTSGGGMLVSADPTHASRARFLGAQAKEPALHYEHREVGYNYRLSNLLAALGRAQLAQLPERIAARRAIEARYRAELDDVPGVGFVPRPSHTEANHWLTVLTIDPTEFGATARELVEKLDADDIEARPAWKPMHRQPLFADAPMRGGTVADAIFETGMCVPSGSSLDRSDQQRVIDAIRSHARV